MSRGEKSRCHPSFLRRIQTGSLSRLSTELKDVLHTSHAITGVPCRSLRAIRLRSALGSPFTTLNLSHSHRRRLSVRLPRGYFSPSSVLLHCTPDYRICQQNFGKFLKKTIFRELWNGENAHRPGNMILHRYLRQKSKKEHPDLATEMLFTKVTISVNRLAICRLFFFRFTEKPTFRPT